MSFTKNKEVEIKWTLELCRAKTGLSQKEMAKAIGVSEQSYMKYENYKTGMKVDKAFKFAEVVGMPVDKIIFFNH